MSNEAIRDAAQLIRSANYAVALTGAGISTPSGIPDFRSTDAGLWTAVNAHEIASILGFRRRPEAFYEWIRPLAHKMLTAQPNAAHIALAQLERTGVIKELITQNVDMLHAKAGSENVYEVHGHFRQMTCIECFREYNAAPILHSFLTNGNIPHCTECEGILKPNVILYGEQLPVQQLFAAQQAARRCDMMLVVGSSLEAVPAGNLPRLAKQNGAKLVVVNFTKTHIDRFADVLIRDDVAQVLPDLAMAVTEEI